MFNKNWKFAENHMPEIKRKLMMLPSGIFLDFSKSEIKLDYEEATDLVVNIAGGTMAVRVRRREHFDIAARLNSFDWSIRYDNSIHRTEIHKLREGFADWYFYGYSENDATTLIAYWLIDLENVRLAGILEDERIGNTWPIHNNHDGTSGLYIPIRILEDNRCIMHCEYGQGTNTKQKKSKNNDQISLF